MPSSVWSSVLSLVAALSGTALAQGSQATPRSLTQLLPDDAVVTARAQGLWPALTAAWPHWAWSRLPWAELHQRLDPDGRRNLERGLAFLRLGLTGRDQELLLDLVSGEVVAALLPWQGKPGLLVLARTRHAEELSDAVRRLARLAKAEVHDDLPGVDVAAVLPGGAAVAARDGVLLLASAQGLGQQVLERWERGAHAAAPSLRGVEPLVLRVDLLRARALAQGQGIFGAQPLDVGGLVLALPVVAALRAAPRVELVLAVTPAGVALRANAPAALAGLDGAQRELLRADTFAPDLVPELPGEVAALALCTSLPVLVTQRQALLRESDRAGAEQAVSLFTLLFAQHKLEREILPVLQDGFHLVLNRERWEQVTPLPPARLPTAALVLGLRDATRERAFHAAFENAVRFGEGDRRRQGKLVFTLERDTVGEALLTTARPKLPADRHDVPLDAGLSPTLAAAGGRVVLASSETLATALVEAAAAAPVGATRPAVGARCLGRLRAAGPAAALALADGRDALLAQRMLDTGRERADLEQDLAGLGQVIAGLRRVRAELTANAAGDLELRLDLALAEAGR